MASNQDELDQHATATFEGFTRQWSRTIGASEDLPSDATLTFGQSGQRALMAQLGAEAAGFTPRPRARETHGGGLVMLESLGEGGMGLVKLARQVALEREVAVKTLKEEVDDPACIAVLRREAMITGVLEHPNIVPIYALGESESGRPLVVMKRILGREWSALFSDPLGTEEYGYHDALEFHLHVCQQVCRAVHFAHSKGILHRDLKPENVMIGEFGEVYVVDWGMAVSLDPEHAGRFPLARDVDTPGGTPVYMAPEMVLGQGELLGVHTDVYLLGAILHQILTGRPPHEGETMMQVLFAAYASRPPEFDAAVPAELARICRKAMAADPSQRYPSSEALQRDIGEFLRYRASRELVETAMVRLRFLRQRRDGSAPERSNLVHDAYTEGRFAFEQALQIWPDNPEARQGREEMIRLMAGFEIEERNHPAANRLLLELTEPDPMLQEALEQLEAQLAREEEEVEAFRQRRFDEDLEIGRGRRGVVLAIIALVGGLAPLAYRLSPAAREVAADPSHALYLGMLAPLFGVVALVLFLFLRSGVNEVNRRIAHLFLLILTVTALHRLLAWGRGVAVLDALSQELVFVGLLLGSMGILLDRRFFGALIPYGIALPLLWLVPSWTLEIYSLSHTAALLLLAAPWWPLQEVPR